MTSGRTTVLARVTQALADVQGRARTQPQVLALLETGESMPELARKFSSELATLQGHAFVVADRTACAAAVSAYLRERGARSVAVQSRDLGADIASRLPGVAVTRGARSDKAELARVDCGLLEAVSLLADTGAAIVLCDNAGDRVLPYLPRTCVIVAGMATLHSSMSPQALACIQSAADAKVPGEALIVAGPSRTADIEKTLVLGAHGPQALAVFIIENP